MAGLSPTIGKIAGIEIELHWSFLLLLVFMLIISLYAFALFVILFICVLLHELAHSITSQHYKIKVKKIVLLPIGGISVMDLDTVKPKQEFNIALAGPFASIALGIIFWILLFFVPGGIIRQTITFIFEMNIILGVFNLLPGFPLDGGRVLRAYLERKRSYLKSTQISVKVSNISLVIFVIASIIFAIYAKGYSVSGREFFVFYDIFIVIFLYSGSRAELHSAYVKVYASDLYAKDAISKNFLVVNRNSKLFIVYKKMLKKHVHVILFKEKKIVKFARIPSKIQGIKIPRDVYSSTMERPISDFGIEIPTAKYNEKLSKVMNKLESSNSSLLAVLKKGKIIGIASTQHIEAIIALHISNKLHRKIKYKGNNDRRIKETNKKSLIYKNNH